MRPEQPGTGLAQQRHWADSAPGGTLSTGRLQGLIQSARTTSLCFLLPRVHAADFAAAQPAQMSHSSSSSPAPAHTPSPSTMPSYIGKPEFPETGWDRIKDVFEKDVTHYYSEELRNVFKNGVFAGVLAFVYGGLPAARNARRRYIELSQAEIYTSRGEAVRMAHNAAVRGFLRYGWRWSWRVAALVTLFSSVSTGLSVYRDKYALSHYTAAGAVTAGVFRLNLGLRGFVAGAIFGSVLGTSFGALSFSVQMLLGEAYRARSKRQRRELHEQRLAEWVARLQLTDELIGDLTVRSGHEHTNQDDRRIRELLSLPRNNGDAQDSGSQ